MIPDDTMQCLLGLPLDCAIERLRALGRWSDDWQIESTEAPGRMCVQTNKTARIVRVVGQCLTIAYFSDTVEEED